MQKNIFLLKKLFFLFEKNIFQFLPKPNVDFAIITRFNIEADYSKTSPNNLISKNQNICCDENYLNQRFFLFEKYYIPSLLAQTDKNFKIYVCFHSNTPKCFLDKISQYQILFNGRFIPIFSEKFNLQLLVHHIIKNKSADWIMTLRLDNDDAISSNFVQNTKKYFVPINNYYINYYKGLQYVQSIDKFFTYFHNSNHFLVLVEKISDSLTTAYAMNHSKVFSSIPNFFNVKINQPMTLEVVHELNVLNEPFYDLNTYKTFFDISNLDNFSFLH